MSSNLLTCSLPPLPLPLPFQDKPTLLISHHRLEGRIVNLVKPLAVLEKRRRDEPKEELDQKLRDEEDKAFRIGSSPIGMRNLNGRKTRVSRNLGEDDDDDDEEEEEDEGSHSTSALRKGFNLNSIPNESPSMAKRPKTSIEKGKGKAEEGMELETPSKSRLQRMQEDSSPMPLPAKCGEALDFSSPQSARRPSHRNRNHSNLGAETGNEDGMEDEAEGIRDERSLKPTSTSYDMICIIRKKILFDKRPEPVVRLEGAEGIEMAKTLGIKI